MAMNKNRKVPLWIDRSLFFVVSFLIFMYFEYEKFYNSVIIGSLLLTRILAEVNYYLVFNQLPIKVKEFIRESKQDMAEMTAGEKFLGSVMILSLIGALLYMFFLRG